MKTITKILVTLSLIIFGLIGGHFVFDHVEINRADALVSYPPAALLQPGDITSTMIRDGTVVDADISNSASFSLSKLAGGTSGFLLGDVAGTIQEISSGNAPVFSSVFVAPGANSSITSLTGLTTPLTTVQGGTGADLSGALQGRIPYFSSTGVMSSLATGTSGQFLQTQGAGANPVWATATAVLKTVWNKNPEYQLPTIGNGPAGFGNTTMRCNVFSVPGQITVNQISIDATVVTVAGTVKLAVYTEDGQTQKFGVTTASISGTGLVSTAVGSVVLSPGNYYLCLVQVGTSNLQFTTYSTETQSFALESISTKNLPSGNITVSAGTLPSTIDPTALAGQTYSSFAARLDN